MLTVTFDPGRSNGIVVGHYSETEPWTLVRAFQVDGGAEGLSQWIHASKNASLLPIKYLGEPGYGVSGCIRWSGMEVSAEKWVPYPTPGHSATLDSTYPLVGEGVLIALGLMPDEFPHPAWQRSGEQYPFPAPPGTPANRKLAAKKKLRQDWLKKHDLWLTGKDVGQSNADDAISALSHALVRMRKIKHMPTMVKYFGEEKYE